MLGLLNLLTLGIAGLISGTSETIHNEQEKERYREQDRQKQERGIVPWNTYVDRKGVTRRIDNNHPVRIDWDGSTVNDDKLLIDIITHEVRNVSEEQRKLNFEKKRHKTDRKAILYNPMGWFYYEPGYRDEYTGRRINGRRIFLGEEYKDVKTQQPLYRRRFEIHWDGTYGYKKDNWKQEKKYLVFYMDRNGYLISLADEGNENVEYTEEEVQAFIKKVNEKQRKGGFDEGCKKPIGKMEYYEAYLFTKYEWIESKSKPKKDEVNKYAKEMINRRSNGGL